MKRVWRGLRRLWGGDEVACPSHTTAKRSSLGSFRLCFTTPLRVEIYIYIDFAYKSKKIAKTYNSGDSLIVTYLTTNLLVRCLNIAKQIESLIII